MKPNPFITQERNKCMDTEGHAPAKTLVIQFHPYFFTTSHWLADFSSFYIYVLSNFTNITIPFISINFPVVSNAWFSKIFRKIDCSNAFFFLHMYFLKIKTYLREITEKFLSTLLLMFLSSCYLIENARRERTWYSNADKTGARSNSEIQEKRKGQKKYLSAKACKCYKPRKLLWKNHSVI